MEAAKKRAGLKQKLAYQKCLLVLIWLSFCITILLVVFASGFKIRRSEKTAPQLVTFVGEQIELLKYASKNIPLKSSIVNINLAQKDELITLPGIGEKTAERIIKYRDKHLRFYSIYQLKKVKGIGEKRLSKIKEKISI